MDSSLQNAMSELLTTATHEELMAFRSTLKVELAQCERIRAYNPGTADKQRAIRRIHDIQQRLCEIKALLPAAKQERSKFNQDDHLVSDHALCRYLERVRGIDIKKLKDHILWNTRFLQQDQAAYEGDSRRLTDIDGFTYLVKEGRLITILDPEMTVPGEEAA